MTASLGIATKICISGCNSVRSPWLMSFTNRNGRYEYKKWWLSLKRKYISIRRFVCDTVTLMHRSGDPRPSGPKRSCRDCSLLIQLFLKLIFSPAFNKLKLSKLMHASGILHQRKMLKDPFYPTNIYIIAETFWGYFPINFNFRPKDPKRRCLMNNSM